jgi:hypothetical protein
MVKSMVSVKEREDLRRIRTEIAVNIAASNPALLRKIKQRKPEYASTRERAQADILKSMLEAEPLIKHILEAYAA